jgi:GDP-6-deoxy-D-talose 4-dehydrogenase
VRILLTGAAGFTGRHFSQHARAAGHEVVPLAADLTDRAAVQASVAQALAPSAQGEPISAVVHLAAISFVAHHDDAALYAVNTVGATHLLDALASLPEREHLSRVLLASSANVYGNCLASPIAETEPPAPVNHYAASKLAMEHMALAQADRLPIVITRPFNYTGPGQASSFLIPKLIDHFKRKAPVIELGNTHVEREYNDVRTVSEACLRLLSRGKPGEVYNLCSGVAHTLQAVLAELTGLTGHHPRVQVNPAFVRPNELHRLCGSPAKLLACIGPLPALHLRDTLGTMLMDFG